jgi:hypothetical protein
VPKFADRRESRGQRGETLMAVNLSFLDRLSVHSIHNISILTGVTQRNIPEDGTLHGHHRGNPKSPELYSRG